VTSIEIVGEGRWVNNERDKINGEEIIRLLSNCLIEINLKIVSNFLFFGR
jgi:hypothetical protein